MLHRCISTLVFNFQNLTPSNVRNILTLIEMFQINQLLVTIVTTNIFICIFICIFVYFPKYSLSGVTEPCFKAVNINVFGISTCVTCSFVSTRLCFSKHTHYCAMGQSKYVIGTCTPICMCTSNVCFKTLVQDNLDPMIFESRRRNRFGIQMELFSS